VPKVPGEDRALAFIAKGSHGIWDRTGSLVYQDVSTINYRQCSLQLTETSSSVCTNLKTKQETGVSANGVGKTFKLRVYTGPIWNAKDNIYPIEYLPSATYSGDQAWLNFQGAWGNKGDRTCWYYSITKVVYDDSM
jgi:hypothetical protein